MQAERAPQFLLPNITNLPKFRVLNALGPAYYSKPISGRIWCDFFRGGRIFSPGDGCFGDSGGGWYNEDGYLVGITSDGNGDGYYDSTIGMDLTHFNSWIDGIQATVPEPSTFVLLFLLALAISPFRGRRRV